MARTRGGLAPASPVDELRLLHEVRHTYPELAYEELDRDVLSCLTRKHGVDFATALFYDRLKRSHTHGAFIRSIDALQPDLESRPRLRGKLLVAPAALAKEFPAYGGDGRSVREIAAELGMETELLPVSSTGTVRENAAAIREALRREPRRDLVLVSLSKGGADLRAALEGEPELAGKIAVWVQICGLLRGTLAADSLLRSRTPTDLGARLFLRWHGIRTGVLRELRAGPGSLLAETVQLPAGLRVVSIVGVPLTQHLSGVTRARHRLLSSFGPNDGSTLLTDAVLEPGLVYPVWGADHYFRLPSVPALLRRLFLYLSRAGIVGGTGEWEGANGPRATRTPELAAAGRQAT